jgi:2-C-methyl-D-erythritol 4-phosphate cytidylyltransferase
MPRVGATATDTVAGLVPAAGSGERLGRGPKAFVDLAGTPMLVWAVAALAARVDVLAVGVAEIDLARTRTLLAPWSARFDVRLVVGGASRQATVQRLLASVESDVVVVHDAARPFLDASTLEAVIAAAREHGACSVGQPVADSLVRAHDGAPVDRAQLRAVQTPQAFRREVLQRAHEAAVLDGWAATDDAGLVWRMGHRVAWVAGGSHLFKVTTPSDFTLAEAVVASGAFGVTTPEAPGP